MAATDCLRLKPRFTFPAETGGRTSKRAAHVPHPGHPVALPGDRGMRRNTGDRPDRNRGCATGCIRSALVGRDDGRAPAWLGDRLRVRPGADQRPCADRGEGTDFVLRRGDIALAVRSARALPEIDVAVLQIDAPGIAEPALRRAPPVEAEPLFVAGAGTSGVLAGRGRMMAPSTARRFGGGMIAALLPVARGYSGTPVVDAEGRLVGIVAAAVAEDLNTARRLSAVSGNEPPSHWVTLIVPVGTILEGIPMTDRPWSCRPDANAGSCPAT